MKVYLIRHGEAEDRARFVRAGNPDDFRALTDEGVNQLDRLFGFLEAKLARIELIVSSPLLRATQTADILAKYCPEAKRAESKLLRPEMDTDQVLDWLETNLNLPRIALVGHEPLLSTLASALISSGDRQCVSMKKGAVCCLEFSGGSVRDGFVLKWFINPKLLP